MYHYRCVRYIDCIQCIETESTAVETRNGGDAVCAFYCITALNVNPVDALNAVDAIHAFSTSNVNAVIGVNALNAVDEVIL